MSVSLLLGVVYLISELLLATTRRSRSRTGTKQDRRYVARRKSAIVSPDRLFEAAKFGELANFTRRSSPKSRYT